MIPRHTSARKLRRKIKRDGLYSGIVAAVELFFRRKFGPKIFDTLIEAEIIKTEQKVPNEVFNINVGDGEKHGNSFITVINNGYVIPEFGLYLSSEFNLVSNPFPEYTERSMLAKRLVRQFILGEPAISWSIIKGTGRSLSYEKRKLICPLTPSYPNYYHWTVEVLPQIRYIRQYEGKKSNEIELLVPNNLPDWSHQTLRMMDIPESKIEYATEPIYRSHQLVVPSFPSKSHQDFLWLRQQMLSHLDNTTIDNEQNNILISRENALDRRIVNQSDVMQVLSKYGFQKYVLEQNSVEENITAFNNANIIVGAHGAGLADMIYSDDATVIELYSNHNTGAYEKISNVLDINYDYLKCEGISTDLLVDVDELERKILEISR